jgi:hypothetical protein
VIIFLSNLDVTIHLKVSPVKYNKLWVNPQKIHQSIVGGSFNPHLPLNFGQRLINKYTKKH